MESNNDAPPSSIGPVDGLAFAERRRAIRVAMLSIQVIGRLRGAKRILAAGWL